MSTGSVASRCYKLFCHGQQIQISYLQESDFVCFTRWKGAISSQSNVRSGAPETSPKRVRKELRTEDSLTEHWTRVWHMFWRQADDKYSRVSSDGCWGCGELGHQIAKPSGGADFCN